MVQATQQKPGSKTILEKNWKFDIDISADRLFAHLTITKPESDAEFEFSADELVAILNRAGVTHGIKTDQISKIIDAGLFGKRMEIARGRPPSRGKDSDFETLFPKEVSKSPVVGPDGLIDYKNLGIIRNAKKGQPLARRIPPTTGEPGFTIDGEEIPGLPGREKALPKGKNTQVSPDDPNVLIAADDGAIQFSNDIISVDKIYKILGDVDISTGNINYVGNLQIGGGIKAGFKVMAEGDIEIEKNIEDAEVVSGGSIVAKGGFVGSGSGFIRAKNDLIIRFVENGNIEVGNDIHISGQALNSNIFAGNAIYLKGAKAIILGGQVGAFNLVETDVIGSVLGTKTIVRVGFNPAMIKEFQHLENECKRLKADQERIKQAIYSLTKLEIDNKLNKAQAESLAQLKAVRNDLPKQIEEIDRRKSALFAKINDHKNAKIVVRGTAYHGTIIQIGLLKKELIQDVTRCTFKSDGNQIVMLTHY